jgi:hypothetical protein
MYNLFSAKHFASFSTRLTSLWIVLLAIGLVAARAGRVQADEAESNMLNWAYQSSLGDGLFIGTPEKARIYNLPFSYTSKDINDSGWALKFELPLTVGVYRFQTADDNINVDVMSVVPGIELHIPVRDYWTLIPLAGFGLGKDTTDGRDRNLYSVGIKHYLSIGWENVDVTYGNTLRRDGYSARGEGRSGYITSADAGLDVRFPLGFNLLRNPAHLSVYGIYRHYFEDTSIIHSEENYFKISDRHELGITLGTIPSLKIWRFPLERIGIGYRSGDRFSTLRVVFGMPF